MAHSQELRKRQGLRPDPIRLVRSFGSRVSAAPAGEGPGFFVPGASLTVRSEVKPEWQLLQLLLSYPESVRVPAERVDMEWLSDERVRDVFDHALALLAERNALPLWELMERIPEPLHEVLTALNIVEGENPDSVAKKWSQLVSALELRHLLRAKREATTPVAQTEIHKRIQALQSRKGGNP